MRSSTTLLSLLLLTLWPFSTSASASSHSPASSDHRPRYLTKKGNLVNNPHLKGRYSGRDASPAGMNVARWNRWAKYKRDEAPLPLHSPLSGVNPSLSVQQQIKKDVNSVLGEFTSLPANVQNLLKTALNAVLGQSMYAKSIAEQFDTVSNAIKSQLAKVQQSLPTTLSAISAMDDTGNVAALESCINTIVSMGGRQTEKDGTCLTQSGYSLDSLTSQFKTFVDVNQFVIPAEKANQAYNDIMDYLNSVELVPSEEYLIGNASEAIHNAILATAAKDRDASESAFECWIKSIQMISTEPLAKRQLECDTGMDGSSGVKGTTLGDIEEAYIDKVNQFAGVLPAELVANIQAIGITKLTLNVGSFDSNVRNNINSAILSATAATSGETASLVYNLLDCLNTIYDDTPDQECNPNSNPEILNHNKNIYYNYLAQFVSILPKAIVQDLNDTVTADLESASYANADELRSQLDTLWKDASLGTEYESCARDFTECVVQAMSAGTATTTCTENKGAACQDLPVLAADQINSSSPYGDIAGGLAGNGAWGTKRKAKRAARRESRLVVA